MSPVLLAALFLGAGFSARPVSAQEPAPAAASSDQAGEASPAVLKEEVRKALLAARRVRYALRKAEARGDAEGAEAARKELLRLKSALKELRLRLRRALGAPGRRE